MYADEYVIALVLPGRSQNCCCNVYVIVHVTTPRPRPIYFFLDTRVLVTGTRSILL